MRVDNEIRFYAGVGSPYEGDYQYEIGVFKSNVGALSFAKEFIVARSTPPNIDTDRVTLRQFPK
jgi:hypothetical protein